MGRTELVIGRGNPFGLRARTMSSDILVKDAGAAALLDWPNSFYRIAELVGSSRKEHRGLKRFGYLHRFAAASGSRSFGPSLQEAYRRFLTKSQGMKEESLPDFLARPEGGAYITSGESDRLLGGTPQMVSRVKASAFWVDVKRKSVRRGRELLLPRREVEAAVARVSSLIAFHEAASLIGLPKQDAFARIQFLVQSWPARGVPIPFWPPGRPSQGRKTCGRSARLGHRRALDPCKAGGPDPLHRHHHAPWQSCAGRAARGHLNLRGSSAATYAPS